MVAVMQETRVTSAEATNLPDDWPPAGQEFGPVNFGPFGPSELALYAAASGDDNPLHLDPAIAKAAGLEAPPVHGMLMMSCFEPAIAAWRPDLAIARLSAKFLRPVLRGESITILGRVVRSSWEGRAQLVLRLTARGADGALSILGEAVLHDRDAEA
jgi:acyl dehydratase